MNHTKVEEVQRLVSFMDRKYLEQQQILATYKQKVPSNYSFSNNAPR